MKRPSPGPEQPKPAAPRAGPPAGDVSPAEQAARAAKPGAISDEEKARLAAEVSRIEDA